MNYVEHIKNAVEKANKNESKITNDILELKGMSGAKTRHLYNNLVNFEGARYLEIGSWKGSSLGAAMYKNKANVVCVDNFSEFLDENPRQHLFQVIRQYKGDCSVNFIEEDCFEIDVSSLPKFNIYLYDGEHSSESHKKSLVHFYDCLDDTFIFIVDDWNWDDIKLGTIQAITQLNLEILHKIEIFTEVESGDKEGYWNGVMVCVLKKPSQEALPSQ